MKTDTKKISLTKKKLLIDIVVFIMFAIISTPESTGIAIHEWLGLIFVVPIIVHLLLNWKWIVKMTSRIFKKTPGEARFNYIWDLALFIVMVLLMVSGILISESVLLALGIAIIIDPFWSVLHNVLANIFLLLMIGVHLALHWRWIVVALKKYVFCKTGTSPQATGGQ